MDEKDQKEQGLGSSTGSTATNLTFQKAIEMGEYDPEFLANFPEWHTFSRHTQFEYIREGLANRRKHLLTQWAEINNVLDFRLKPHLNQALKNVEDQLEQLLKEKERLFVEYSKQ